ncbi:unnamed protein product, partial [Mesorhabditis belari]|uniref:BTB domain-containing protein n=1 Tax=Mesorhabditis belari TaxID=2138241 RepID=A0AAF3J359_9BILA
MGLREKDRSNRNSMAISEHSLPDRLTQALRALRPANIAHSASGVTPFKNYKNKSGSTVDASNDVVFIVGDKVPPPVPPIPMGRFQKSPLMQKARSVLDRSSVGGSPQLAERNPFHEPALNSLEQIRNLYKSVPNVHYDTVSSPTPTEEDDGFSSTRSPTDSGYRSTPRLDRTPDKSEEANGTSNSLGASSGSGSSRNGFRSKEIPSRAEGEVKNSPKLAMRPQRPQGPTPNSSPPSTVGSKPERHLPFTRSHIDSVLESRRCKSFANYIDSAVLSRFCEVLSEPLDLLTENLQRLIAYSVKCTAQDVASAIKISFPLDLFASCLRSGQKAASAFARNGPGALGLTLSQRSELYFPVGRFYRYIIDKLPSKPISEHAIIFFTAALQCVLEEFVLRLVDTDSPEMLSLSKFEEILTENGGSLVQYFNSLDSLTAMDLPAPISFAKLVDAVHAVRERILHSTGNAKKRHQVQLSRTGIRSLHYFACGPGVRPNSNIQLADWVRLIYAYAEHRMSPTVDELDIMQAARVLRGVDCPPPSVSLCRRELILEANPHEAKITFAFNLIATGNPENARHGIAMLEGERTTARNPFGMCPLAESVVQSNSEATTALLAAGWPTDLAVPADKKGLPEYAGWTPLTWAIAIQKHNIVKMLLNSDAKLDGESMINESPLQISVQQGCLESVRLLLDRGADPTRGWRAEMSIDQHIGCVSPLTASTVRGNKTILSALITKMADQSNFLKHRNGSFSSQNSKSSQEKICEYDSLIDSGKRALREALYYAVETERLDIAIVLRQLVEGLPWSTFLWTRALESALLKSEPKFVQSILSDFGPNIAAELNEDNLARTLTVILKALQHELSYPDGDPSNAALALSRLHHYFKEEVPDHGAAGAPLHRNIIDPSFVNSEQLSDIRFQVEGKLVFGHRIVLVNASDRFRHLLQSPDGVIMINDVSCNVFLCLMEFVYTGRLSSSMKAVGQLFQVLTAAQAFGLPTLEAEVLRVLTHSIDVENFADLYTFAMHHQNETLLKPCEHFLLLHLPVLCSDPRLSILFLQPPPNYDVCVALRDRLSAEFSECRRRLPTG